MPFHSIVPRPFTATAIQTFAPAVSGVYGVSNSHEWIYVGETDNIQRALMLHHEDRNGTLVKKNAKGFVFEICEKATRASRQDRLVQEYEPSCNRFSQEASGRFSADQPEIKRGNR